MSCVIWVVDWVTRGGYDDVSPGVRIAGQDNTCRVGGAAISKTILGVQIISDDSLSGST